VASSSTLVLTKFNVLPGPADPTTSVIDIEGRAEGLIAFILTKMGLSNRVQLVVTSREMVYSEASLSGETTESVPLKAVSATIAGMRKNLWFLLFSILSAIVGLISLLGAAFSGRNAGAPAAIGMFLLIVAAVFIYLYYTRRVVWLGVQPFGGSLLQIPFRPSVIEGVSINEEHAKRAAAILRELVLNAPPRA
jgi:hypothetical protein